MMEPDKERGISGDEPKIPEFEEYVRLLRGHPGIPDLPEFRSEWLTREPTLKVDEVFLRRSQRERSGGKKGVALISVAALVLVAVGLYFYTGMGSRPQMERPMGGKIIQGIATFVSGEVTLTNSGRTARLQRGDTLNEGDRIITGADGQAELAFARGTVLRLQSDSDISLVALRKFEGEKTEKGIAINLARGRTLNIINPRGGIREYRIQTPTAIAGVRGTVLEVWTDGNESGLLLARGRVQVQSRNNEEIYNLKPEQSIRIRAATPDVRITEDKDRSQQALRESEEVVRRVEEIDPNVLKVLEGGREYRSEKEIARRYKRDVEIIRLRDGRVIRGVVVSQVGSRLIIHTVKGSVSLETSQVKNIQYAKNPK